jgi:hypothetical protein
MIADRAAKGRIAGFQRVEDRALCDGGWDFDLHLAVNAGEHSKMIREYDSDHGFAGKIGRKKRKSKIKMKSKIRNKSKRKIKIKIRIQTRVPEVHGSV